MEENHPVGKAALDPCFSVGWDLIYWRFRVFLLSRLLRLAGVIDLEKHYSYVDPDFSLGRKRVMSPFYLSY